MDNELPAEQSAPAPEPAAAPAPDFSPVGFWVRGGALILDTVLLMLGALLPIRSFGVLVNFAYKTIFISQGGQTPGKMAAGIKVIRVTGEPVGVGRALARAVSEYLSAFTLCLGYIAAAFPDKRALHDYIAGTRVVYVDGVSSARKAAFAALGVLGTAVTIAGILVLAATGIGGFGKFKALTVKSGEGATKGNLGSLRSSLAIYYGDAEGHYPATLDALVEPRYLKEIPKTKIADHKETDLWTPYGAEVCTGSSQFGGEIDATKIKDTGGWGYVADPKASCWGMVFVDCTHRDTKGKRWPEY